MALASATISTAHALLADPEGTRWPATELVLYLNEGQREIVRMRPDANALVVQQTLVAGYRQTLPTNGVALMDVLCNSSGSLSSISKVDMNHLDAVSPGWRSKSPTHNIVHYMPDPREPRIFYVYPPATTAAKVELLYSVTPTACAATTALASSVTGTLDIEDIWVDALTNYVLYRAYSKDVEYGGNAQVAAAYLGLFTTAMGVSAQQTAAAT